MADDNLQIPQRARTTAVVNRLYNGGKPFELCVQVHSPDGDTRLEHEDYFLDEKELLSLRNSILEVEDLIIR